MCEDIFLSLIHRTCVEWPPAAGACFGGFKAGDAGFDDLIAVMIFCRVASCDIDIYMSAPRIKSSIILAGVEGLPAFADYFIKIYLFLHRTEVVHMTCDHFYAAH